MPPKASSPKKSQVAETGDSDVPSINPDVLLYLQGASRAFPVVESSLCGYAATCRAQLTGFDASFESKTVELDGKVKRFNHERAALEAHINDQQKHLEDTKSKIVSSVKDFEAQFHAEEQRGRGMIDELRAEVAALRQDAEEAEDWSYQVHRRKRELQDLLDNIEAMKLRNNKEIVDLRAVADSEKRKLRDSLVRKLRRARDQLTSSTDDDVAGRGTDDGSPFQGFGSAMVPSAKQNEKLSREVTMYERDCDSIRHHNRSLVKEDETLRNALESERSTNEILVMKNASHIKAKKILGQQLKDVEAQFTGAMDHHHAQQKDRLQALRDTVGSQSTIIDDLQCELEVAFDEYDLLREQLRQQEVEASRYDSDCRLAGRFLRSIQPLSGVQKIQTRSAVLNQPRDVLDGLLSYVM